LTKTQDAKGFPYHPVNPVHPVSTSMILLGYLIADISKSRGRQLGLFFLLPFSFFIPSAENKWKKLFLDWQ
jgi:hypothetical protein